MIRVLAIGHFLGEGPCRQRDLSPEVCVTFGEIRAWPGAQPQHLRADEHLTITVRTSADADSRDVERFGYSPGRFGRNRFEEKGAGPGRFHPLSVVE